MNLDFYVNHPASINKRHRHKAARSWEMNVLSLLRDASDVAP